MLSMTLPRLRETRQCSWSNDDSVFLSRQNRHQSPYAGLPKLCWMRIDSMPVFLVQQSKYIYVVGLTVKNSANGIKLWPVENCMLDRVTVVGTNVEAIHVEYHSHYNTVKNCSLRDTGRKINTVVGGEGIIYIPGQLQKKLQW